MQGPITVIICDADGRVLSASGGRGAAGGGAAGGGAAAVGESLAGSPKMREWVAVALERAREDGVADTCVVLEDDGVAHDVAVVPLEGPDGAAFAVVTSRSDVAAIAPHEVSQKAWHDIKNQLGGLKLYATFLRRRFVGDDELAHETVGKIVSGIDAVVEAIAAARRGEEDAKGDGQ
jgi:hypothetical protein